MRGAYQSGSRDGAALSVYIVCGAMIYRLIRDVTLGLLGVALTGCAMRIAPPVGVRDPVSVFVADYGIHASLLLPREDGGLSEFAYGEYDWFALNHDHWYNAIPIILFPHKAAFGTRVVDGPATADSLRSRLPIEGLHELRVERDAAAAELFRLESRYEQGKPARGEIYNSNIGLMLVEDPAAYSLCHNCNIELASWLEAVGCRVAGYRAAANFIIAAPESAGTAPPPRASPAAP